MSGGRRHTPRPWAARRGGGSGDDNRATGLGAVLSECGLGEETGSVIRMAGAQARWAQVAGEQIATHTAVLSVDRAGVVTIGVPSAPWRQRLERQKRTLEGAFDVLPDGRRVGGLRFRVVPAAEIAPRVASPSAGQGRRRGASGRRRLPPLRAVEARALDALDRGPGAELRSLFESWMRHTNRRHDD